MPKTNRRNKFPILLKTALLFFAFSLIITEIALTYYALMMSNKNKTTFMWITLGLGAASFVLGNSNGDLDTLVRYALLFFESWAFYNMFKNLNPKNSIVYTVFTALTGTLLGGVFLYVMKYEDSVDADNNSKNETKEADIVEEKKTIDTKKTTKKEDNKLNFCDNCGAKLAKTAKFCSECGKKIN